MHTAFFATEGMWDAFTGRMPWVHSAHTNLHTAFSATEACEISCIHRKDTLSTQCSPKPVYCHWRELPQVSFLSRQKFCHDKHIFCQNSCLSWQTCVCCDKTHLLSWRKCVVMTKLLWRQTYFCGDKHNFVATKHLSWQTHKYLSWQKFCHNKNIVVTNNFVTTKVLSQQAYYYHHKRCFAATNTCLLQQNFCHNKNGTYCSSHQWQHTAFSTTEGKR